MDCLIFYELVERSYENDLLIKLELERRGFKVKLVNMYWRDFWKSFFYHPRIYVVPSCRDTNVMSALCSVPYKEAAWVNLQEEQIGFSNEADISIFLPQGRAKEAAHLCWGETAAGYMKRAGVRNEYIIPSGPVQFDLCSPRFKDYFYDKKYLAEEFGLDVNKKWILFASDFCTISECQTEESLRYKMNRFGDFWKTMYDYETECSEMLTEWWSRYLSTHDDTIFIYRPHPSEYQSIGRIEELEKKHDNFVCIKKYSIKQWIHVADAFTTWISSSVMEAFYLGIPCFALGKEKGIIDSGLAIALFRRDRYITDYELFEKAMDDPSAMSSEWNPVNKEEAERIYGKKTDVPAYIGICDYLEALLRDKERLKKMRVRLTKEEKRLELGTKLTYVKTTLYNDTVCRIWRLLCVLMPWKKKNIIKYKDSLSRFDRRFLRDKEDRLRRITG